MITTIVIDDVKIVRQTIVQILKQHFDELLVIAEAESVKSGLEQIAKHEPEAIFLDVEMKDGTGFDLLKQLDYKKYKIIFITAYDHYAIKAFKYSAIDYLLKPIDLDELEAAIHKLKDAIDKEAIEIKFNTLFQNIQSPQKEEQKIILKTIGNTYSVYIKDIVRCESDNNYTHFYLKDGKKILVSVTLKEYEELLTSHHFFRIHQSHLINLNFFDCIKNRDASIISMKDKTELPLASRRKNDFIETIKSLRQK